MLAYRHHLPPSILKKFYFTFIHPRLEYCSAVWGGAPRSLLVQLEKVQLKVAKALIYSSFLSGLAFSSSQLLSRFDLATLSWRRREHALLLLWKLFHGIGPSMLRSFLPAAANERSARTLRSGHSLRFPNVSTSQRLSSFLCTVIPLWNSLPSPIILSKSPYSFRRALQEHFSNDKFTLGL